MIVAMIGAVFAGGLAAWGGVLPAWLTDASGGITTGALWLLLLVVGFDIGRDRQAITRLATADRLAFLVPVGTIIGTLAGGLAAAALSPLVVRDALAVAAGFGWYSLSAVIIAKDRGADLGAVAFLANVFRETLAIVLIPIVARRLGPFAAIAPGGATTMDTTLPIIERYAGPEAALAGFVNGFVLSALVPVLVPLFLG
jgi:uncharacterized membrane protein YbjE (DUF340 family)